MREHILDKLPNSKEFELSPDTTLVGVGGTLRAIARYDQQLRDYPLDKVHNYSIDYASLASIAEKLYEMDADQLAEIKAIGSNRTDTVTAGATVIEMLMKKFDFNRIVVSAQGLREGILAAFIHDSKTFYNSSSNNSPSNEKAKEILTFACRTEMLPTYTAELIKPMVAAGLLREKERMILAHAIKQKARLPPITNLNNLFYMIMDEDNAFLSHREQLLLALSIVRTRKEKAADWLFSRYKPMLEPQNKKSIEKISACIILSSLLEKTKADVAMSITGKKIVMKITPLPSQFIPFLLYNNAINNFQRAFDVSIKYSIEQVKLPALTKERRGHDNEE
jgi:exopolyphosphatase/guanosine-5'-triphosphate,3'-diphosphate pyrophosphatase